MDQAVEAETVGNGAASVPVDTAVLDAVTGVIGKLRFGTVLVTVHEGKVVQIDTTERRRFS